MCLKTAMLAGGLGNVSWLQVSFEITCSLWAASGAGAYSWSLSLQRSWLSWLLWQNIVLLGLRTVNVNGIAPKDCLALSRTPFMNRFRSSKEISITDSSLGGILNHCRASCFAHVVRLGSSAGQCKYGGTLRASFTSSLKRVQCEGWDRGCTTGDVISPTNCASSMMSMLKVATYRMFILETLWQETVGTWLKLKTAGVSRGSCPPEFFEKVDAESNIDRKIRPLTRHG